MGTKAVLIDLSGQRFGKLLVISRAPNEPNGKARWVCVCDCGKTTTVAGSTLRYGGTKSCGHRDAETLRKMGAFHLSHGMDGTPEYRAWVGMRGRCNNPSYKAYPSYGGRGIYVCERWQSRFENFFADMGKRPTQKHSIDRIDNDGPYSPENCRWATQSEQVRNRRNSLYVEFEGQVRLLAGLANETGLSLSTLGHRAARGTHGLRLVPAPSSASGHTM
jgi:hypothetical protein